VKSAETTPKTIDEEYKDKSEDKDDLNLKNEKLYVDSSSEQDFGKLTALIKNSEK